MEQNNNEPVQVFNNGCIYYAHITTGEKVNEQKELGHHTIVFYERFSGQNIIASLRGPITHADQKPYIRKLVDKEIPLEDMRNICLDVLVSLLRKDVAHDWYADKTFVLGKIYNESIQEHIKKSSNFKSIEASDLRLDYIIPLKE